MWAALLEEESSAESQSQERAGDRLEEWGGDGEGKLRL